MRTAVSTLLVFFEALWLAGCHTSLVFVDREVIADGGIGDSASDATRPVVTRFGGPSVGPERMVSSARTSTPFLDSAPRLQSQFSELHDAVAAKNGDVRVIAWIESQLGRYVLRAARIDGFPSTVQTLPPNSWVIDDAVDEAAHPEVVATETGFTLLWSRRTGVGESYRLVSVDISVGQSEMPSRTTWITRSRDPQRITNVAYYDGRLWAVMREYPGGPYRLHRTQESTSAAQLLYPVLRDDWANSYFFRIRVNGNSLLLIGPDRIVRYTHQNRVPVEEPSLWTPPAHLTPAGPSTVFVDALALGTRWLVITCDANANASVFAERRFFVHLADEQDHQLVYRDTLETSPVWTGLGTPFARASLAMEGSRIRLRLCADSACVQDNIRLHTIAVVGDQLEEVPASDEPEPSTDDRNRHRINATETLVHTCERPIERLAVRRCWLELRDDNAAKFRVEAEADQSAPTLFATSSEVGVTFEHGATLRLAAVEASPTEGVAFGSAAEDEHVGFVREVNGEPWVFAYRHHGEPRFSSVTYRPRQLAQPVQVDWGFLSTSACRDQVFTVAGTTLELSIAAMAGQQIAQVPTHHLSGSLGRLGQTIELGGGCALVFHDQQNLLIGEIASHDDAFGVSNVRVARANFSGGTYRTRMNLIRHNSDVVMMGPNTVGEAQELVLIRSNGTAETHSVPNFRLPDEQGSGTPNGQFAGFNRQAIASDGASVLLMRRTGSRIEAVRIDDGGREVYRGDLFELRESPEVARELSTLGWTAVLGIAPATFLVAYQRYATEYGAYRIFVREVRFLDEQRLE